MSLISKLKSNAFLKTIALWMIIPTNEYRPRLWVKIFLNPFKHSRGRGSIIRYRTKLDVFPFRKFNLGDYSVIEDFSTINNGVGDVIIGKKSLIGVGNVIIGPVQIGDNAILAQNIVVSGLNHNYENISLPPVKQGVKTDQIIISNDVWIGANSVITAGVTIGEHSVIGAGSIVTKNIPAYTVAVGNPAYIIKRYNRDTNNWDKV